MIVVTVVIRIIVMSIRCMSIGAVRIVMMLHGVAARVARMRPENRDQASENGAQQRQKNDCLNHSWVNPSSD